MPASSAARRSPPPPLDQPALERLALRYVERFATTRAKLAGYLVRKVRERGWADGPTPDAGALAERLAELGYIDDRAYATAKARTMTRRGLGAQRVRGALRQAGVHADDVATVEPTLAEQQVAAALAFARRKRFGPFAAAPADRPGREKQIAAMIRGGHSFALARAIVTLGPEDDLDQRLAPFGMTGPAC